MLTFPVVLIEGELIRAFYDVDMDTVMLRPAPYVRCHWKGSSEWNLNATVDVVTMEAFPMFVEKRAEDCKLLLSKLGAGRR